MKKEWLVLFLGMVVAACATAPPGQDAKGVELRAQSTTVLRALIAYRKDRGHYPTSLQELAPKYVPTVPFDPGLVFDDYAGLISFVYAAPWPQAGDIRCVAKAGETEWDCTH